MTAAALPRAGVRTEDRVRGVGLIRLALRQHRTQIVATVVACGALAAYLLTWRGSRVDLLALDNIENVIRYDVIAFSFVVAVFWGAPMLSREYEQRTHLLVWSQDVSVGRWLLTKVTLLGGIVVVLTVGLELINEAVHERAQVVLRSTGNGMLANAYLFGFEGHVLVQVGYAVAALAIGLAIGGLTRIPVLAMIGSGLVFALLRWAIAVFLRGLYSDEGSFTGGFDQTIKELNQLQTGRMVEFAIYLAIAALALTFAWFGVRRRRYP